jgi:hypothetical protein
MESNTVDVCLQAAGPLVLPIQRVFRSWQTGSLRTEIVIGPHATYEPHSVLVFAWGWQVIHVYINSLFPITVLSMRETKITTNLISSVLGPLTAHIFTYPNIRLNFHTHSAPEILGNRKLLSTLHHHYFISLICAYISTKKISNKLTGGNEDRY